MHSKFIMFKDLWYNLSMNQRQQKRNLNFFREYSGICLVASLRHHQCQGVDNQITLSKYLTNSRSSIQKINVLRNLKIISILRIMPPISTGKQKIPRWKDLRASNHELYRHVSCNYLADIPKVSLFSIKILYFINSKHSNCYNVFFINCVMWSYYLQ